MALSPPLPATAAQPAHPAPAGTSPKPMPAVDLSEASLQARAFAEAMRNAQGLRAKAAPALQAPTFDEQTQTIGQKLIAGLHDVSGKLQADHRNISRQIELAVDTGDNRLMMQAMMAVSDYQQRVQIISKTVAKAGSSLDQLTKLQ
jgi:hypothetical protein